MKIIVFSDSHGSLDHMRRGIELEKPDRVFHLGDVTGDARKLSRAFPTLPMDQVRGNCDLSEDEPEEKEVLVGPHRLWLLHGHTYRVKWGLGPLLSEARARGVDAVFFGHTHQPLCQCEGGIWVMNPGTCRGYPQATCGVAELEDGQIRCRIVDLKA